MRIIGYLCAFTPLEIISAAGFIPFRIKGNINELITGADTQMETLVCSVACGSCDISLKSRYDFLNGKVIPHACDSMSRTYPIWKNALNLPYSHFINMPHGTNPPSLRLLVDGIILYMYKFCDPFGFEIPAMKSYIESTGTLLLYIEDDYSKSSYERIRTRVQAFIELRNK